MTIPGRKEAAVLFVGDVLFLFLALWATLLIRYISIPSKELITLHIVPFGIIFAIWILVFFISDLYKKQTIILKKKLPKIILNAQIINSTIAIIFFYFIPYFGITPKTILFIDLALSFALVSLWRIYLVNVIYSSSRERAIILGTGSDVEMLLEELTNNPKYKLHIVTLSGADPKRLLETITKNNVTTLILNTREEAHSLVQELYKLLFANIQFIDLHSLYEDIFERVPLSLLGDNWFLKNISTQPKRIYDLSKRVMDIVLSVVLGTASLLLYPFVAAAIKIDDGGPVFIFQERVGQGSAAINLVKFRTMTGDDKGKWRPGNANRVTNVGRLLRKTRIDELPQLLNVLKGDISLIGPRPEFSDAVDFYNKEIPHYRMRHLIQPGLSGWAQIHHDKHPHHGTDVVETKNKLSYDLYYIKNRGLMVDLKIALKTIKTLLSQSGV